MKKNVMYFMVWPVLFAALTITALTAQTPLKPENLKADVAGHKVTLSWENPDAAAELHKTGFESENLAADGWTVRTTNGHDAVFTWFSFPTPEMQAEMGETYIDYIHGGERSVMLYPDGKKQDNHAARQDEWLISPVLENAAYLKFHYFVDPMILECGMDETCPDHYVVVVSKDGGETWSEPIWDARDDASGETGWSSVVIALTDEPAGNMRVAFRAYNDIRYELDENGEPTAEVLNEGLHFPFWIDDVTITASRPAEAAAADRLDPQAKMPVIQSYTIKLNGEELETGVRDHIYVDKSFKEEIGEYTYEVIAVTPDGESDPAAIAVEIEEAVFEMPRNVTFTSEYDEELGEYAITVAWEAPEGQFQPKCYNVYMDGESLTWEYTEMEYTVTGCTPGIYEMGVEAEYDIPWGLSEQVTQLLALGVRFGASDLEAEMDGKDVVLTWTAPADEEHPMGTYTVYRGEEKIAEGVKETTYRDVAVADGYYQYAVIAVYADGEEAVVRATAELQVGEKRRVGLPYEQKFNTTFCPKDMRVVNLSEMTPDKYAWYFDDGSRLGVKGEGFEGGYAAVDCADAGFYPIDAALELPALNLEKVTEKSDMTLSFNYSYATNGDDKAGVEWSLDGEEWYVFMELEAYNPEETVDNDFRIRKVEMPMSEADEKVLAAIKAAETLYFRFRYTATSSYHLAVDNVLITAPMDTTGGGSDTTAVEKGKEDVNVTVSAAYGQVRVQAASAIRSVEVYALNGVRLAERAGNDGYEMMLPVAFRGPVVVRVTTAQGVRVVKILL